MKLSKQNIKKQLFHELLDWKALQLHPKKIFDSKSKATIKKSYFGYQAAVHPDKNKDEGCGLTMMPNAPTWEEQNAFNTSQYIFTDTGFFYYKKTTMTLVNITPANLPLTKLREIFSKDGKINTINILSPAQLEQITSNTAHTHYGDINTPATEAAKLLGPLNEYFAPKCGLIRMSKNPRTMTNDELKDLLNDVSYALVGQSVYYVDTGHIDPVTHQMTINQISVQAANYKELAAIFPTLPNELKAASKDDLTKITTLTGHAPHFANEFHTHFGIQTPTNIFCASPLFNHLIIEKKLNDDTSFTETEQTALINTYKQTLGKVTNAPFTGIDIAIKTRNHEMLAFLLHPDFGYNLKKDQDRLFQQAIDIETIEILIQRGATLSASILTSLKDTAIDNPGKITALNTLYAFLAQIEQNKTDLWGPSRVNNDLIVICRKTTLGFNFAFKRLDTAGRLAFIRALDKNDLLRWLPNKATFKTLINTLDPDEKQALIDKFSPAFIAAHFCEDISDVVFFKTSLPQQYTLLINSLPIDIIMTRITSAADVSLFCPGLSPDNTRQLINKFNEKNLAPIIKNTTDLSVFLTIVGEKNHGKFINKLSVETIISCIDKPSDLEWFIARLSDNKIHGLIEYYDKHYSPPYALIISFHALIKKVADKAWDESIITDKLFDDCAKTKDGYLFVFRRLNLAGKALFLDNLDKKSLNKWLCDEGNFEVVIAECNDSQKKIILNKIAFNKIKPEFFSTFNDDKFKAYLSHLNYKIDNDRLTYQGIYFPPDFSKINQIADEINTLVFQSKLSFQEKLTYLYFTRKLVTSPAKLRQKLINKYIGFTTDIQRSINKTEDAGRWDITVFFINIFRYLGFISPDKVTLTSAELRRLITEFKSDDTPVDVSDFFTTQNAEQKNQIFTAVRNRNYDQLWSNLDVVYINNLLTNSARLRQFAMLFPTHDLLDLLSGISPEIKVTIANNGLFLINIISLIPANKYKKFIQTCGVTDNGLICTLLARLSADTYASFWTAINDENKQAILSDGALLARTLSSLPIDNYPALFNALTDDELTALMENNQALGLLFTTLPIEKYKPLVESLGIARLQSDVTQLAHLLDSMPVDRASSLLSVINEQKPLSLEKLLYLIQAIKSSDTRLCLVTALQDTINQQTLTDETLPIFTDLLTLLPENNRIDVLKASSTLLNTYIRSPHAFVKLKAKLASVVTNAPELTILLSGLFNRKVYPIENTTNLAIVLEHLSEEKLQATLPTVAAAIYSTAIDEAVLTPYFQRLSATNMGLLITACKTSLEDTTRLCTFVNALPNQYYALVVQCIGNVLKQSPTVLAKLLNTMPIYNARSLLVALNAKHPFTLAKLYHLIKAIEPEKNRYDLIRELQPAINAALLSDETYLDFIATVALLPQDKRLAILQASEALLNTYIRLPKHFTTLRDQLLNIVDQTAHVECKALLAKLFNQLAVQNIDELVGLLQTVTPGLAEDEQVALMQTACTRLAGMVVKSDRWYPLFFTVELNDYKLILTPLMDLSEREKNEFITEINQPYIVYLIRMYQLSPVTLIQQPQTLRTMADTAFGKLIATERKKLTLALSELKDLLARLYDTSIEKSGALFRLKQTTIFTHFFTSNKKEKDDIKAILATIPAVLARVETQKNTLNKFADLCPQHLNHLAFHAQTIIHAELDATVLAFKAATFDELNNHNFVFNGVSYTSNTLVLQLAITVEALSLENQVPSTYSQTF